MVELEVRSEPADSQAAVRLLAAFAATIAGLYPGWNPTVGPSATPEDFSPPRGCFLVAYADGRPVGCGGFKRLDGRAVEVKRIFVSEDARGAGVARALLRELEERARAADYAAVKLDTGKSQPEARALFTSGGYREIPDYNGNPYAAYWFEKRL